MRRCFSTWRKGFRSLARQLVNHRLILHVRVWCFSPLFPSPDHTVHTTGSDQSAASKSEQETRAKGASLPFYLSVFPRFSTPLQTARTRRVLSEATPVWAQLDPLHLSFYFSLLKQLSEEHQDQALLKKKRKKKEKKRKETPPHCALERRTVQEERSSVVGVARVGV